MRSIKGLGCARDGPKLLSYWGLPNLQVNNREARVSKCMIEARYRASRDSSSFEMRLLLHSIDVRFTPKSGHQLGAL
jgi:hypothetical protein